MAHDFRVRVPFIFFFNLHKKKLRCVRLSKKIKILYVILYVTLVHSYNFSIKIISMEKKIIQACISKKYVHYLYRRNIFFFKKRIQSPSNLGGTQIIAQGTKRTDTDPNGYRDFFVKLVKKIPVSVENVRFSCSMITVK